MLPLKKSVYNFVNRDVFSKWPHQSVSQNHYKLRKKNEKSFLPSINEIWMMQRPLENVTWESETCHVREAKADAGAELLFTVNL